MYRLRFTNSLCMYKMLLNIYLSIISLFIKLYTLINIKLQHKNNIIKKK